MTLLGLFPAVSALLGTVVTYGSWRGSPLGGRASSPCVSRSAPSPAVSPDWVTRQGLVLALAGGTAGVALAFLVTGWLRRLLFGVSPRDPLTFLAVPLMLGAVAVLASWIPARRAARLDPMSILRGD